MAQFRGMADLADRYYWTLITSAVVPHDIALVLVTTNWHDLAWRESMGMEI